MENIKSSLPLNFLPDDGKIINLPFRQMNHILSSRPGSRVLLLQGPVGPFFNKVQSTLNAEGYDAWRICFTAGDRLYAPRKKKISFSSGLSAWPIWFEDFLTYSGIDCILLFGCERPVHRIAIEIARRKNIPVLSLEEGYIRPGYITVERGGNNRLSPLAGRMPSIDYEALMATMNPPRVTDSFSRMCWYGFTYYSYNILSSINQRNTFHKPRALASEAFYWTRNFVRKYLHQGKNYRTIEKLLEFNDHNYFLIPLQVADDSQLKVAGNDWTNEKLIIVAIASFATSAPKSMRLVFKIHPLERGHSRYDRLIYSLSILHSVQDRIDIIDTGSLGLLVRHSVGMLTINSTSGLSAIAHAIPLLVTGQAIYSNTDFCVTASTKKEFDNFWCNSSLPDKKKCQQYLSWLKDNSLTKGDYYAREGIPFAIKGILGKVNSLKTIQYNSESEYSRSRTKNLIN